jgi:hypothetical protein
MTASTTFAPAGSWAVADLLPGSYTLTENIITLLELYPTWNRTASCNGEFSDPTESIATPFAINLPAGENMNCIINNTQNAVISGKKFEDMDGNGASNVGLGLSGGTNSGRGSIHSPGVPGIYSGSVHKFSETYFNSPS